MKEIDEATHRLASVLFALTGTAVAILLTCCGYWEGGVAMGACGWILAYMEATV